jgi:hypothetical protein
MAEQIASKARRRLAAERRRGNSVLFGLGMLGLVGWSAGRWRSQPCSALQSEYGSIARFPDRRHGR